MRTKNGSSRTSLAQLLGVSEGVSTPVACTPTPGHCAHTLQQGLTSCGPLSISVSEVLLELSPATVVE